MIKVGKYLIVRYKEISSLQLYKEVKTDDTRYRVKLSKHKLFKWLTKHNFRFSVGIKSDHLIDDRDYIEVWSNNHRDKYFYLDSLFLKAFLMKYSVTKGGKKKYEKV